ncbi:MAG: hypothetical protein DBY32_09295 [Phascolarctobacterium sp.]|nr:MAG: hypothetical protein DBY32_09250 [Phascolarctobacterium sp.]PWM77010.1 MAG: hypothetical protein DBY32_09295 [Phascolarctobacterium sp.]
MLIKQIIGEISKQEYCLYAVALLIINLYYGFKNRAKYKSISLWGKITYLLLILWLISLIDFFSINILNTVFKTKEISKVIMLLMMGCFCKTLWQNIKVIKNKEKRNKEQKDIIIMVFCILILIFLYYF